LRDYLGRLYNLFARSGRELLGKQEFQDLVQIRKKIQRSPRQIQ
jgi:hypothetical protein